MAHAPVELMNRRFRTSHASPTRICRIWAWFVAAAMALSAPGFGAGATERVDLHFEEVEIPAFAAAMGEMMGRRIVVEEGIKGRVSLTAADIPVGDLYPLLAAVLESAGCAVWEGADGLTRVVSRASAVGALGRVAGPEEPAATAGWVTKVFRLDHLSAQELRNALTEMSGGERKGSLGVLPSANMLVASGPADWVMRVERIAAHADRPGMARVVEIVPLQHASAEEIARQLTEALSAAESEADRIRRQITPGERTGGTVKIVAAPQAGGLILVGSRSAVDEMKTLVARLDTEPPTRRGRLRAIFLRHLPAEEAATNLKALLAASVPGANRSGTPAGPVYLEANPANNALLVDAAPHDFEQVEALVRELDRQPGQVLIEVLIAEVSASEGSEWGIEWAALGAPTDVGRYAFQGSGTLQDTSEAVMRAIEGGLFPQGLTIGVARGMRAKADGTLQTAVPAILNIQALRKDGRFKILSNVPLLAQNNRDASVSVVNNIPILKSTIQGGSGASRDVIQNIERLDVGIKLKLTPHISPDGLVRMTLNPSIEAIVDPGPSGTPFTPTIARREVSTTVTVADGDTIVLSGLIREDRVRSERRIPVLSAIPLVGGLFRRTSDGRERTNLLVFVTPRIMQSPEQGRILTADLEGRSGLSSTNQPGPIGSEVSRP